MSKLSTHVLDTATGRPAAALQVQLERLDDPGGTALLSTQLTGPEGRVADLWPEGALARATYRLTFDTGPYFVRSGRPTLYPRVEIVFSVSAPEEHHHIPLLLSPFGYTTYRGT